ncbi:MAG: 30S ribosomal protein S20 [Eggerthellaceae bacterium]|nr:30S ribosomal protein S20 [Eggerthellaceae bacterium]
MANIKSQKKRIITNEKARMRNKAVKSELKTAIRAVREAVAANDAKATATAATRACRLLDKAQAKGIIHKNQAANRKSGVMQLANTVASAKDMQEAAKAAKAARPKQQKANPDSRKSQKASARKAAADALKKEDKEKAKRREATLKAEKKAAEAKAKAAKEAEEAEKKAAQEAAAAEAEAEQAPAEEATE